MLLHLVLCHLVAFAAAGESSAQNGLITALEKENAELRAALASIADLVSSLPAQQRDSAATIASDGTTSLPLVTNEVYDVIPTAAVNDNTLTVNEDGIVAGAENAWSVCLHVCVCACGYVY